MSGRRVWLVVVAQYLKWETCLALCYLSCVRFLVVGEFAVVDVYAEAVGWLPGGGAVAGPFHPVATFHAVGDGLVVLVQDDEHLVTGDGAHPVAQVRVVVACCANFVGHALNDSVRWVDVR